MRIKASLAAFLALVLLSMPNAALADGSGDRCDGPAAMQDDDCKAKREKPRFQTRFFGDQ